VSSAARAPRPNVAELLLDRGEPSVDLRELSAPGGPLHPLMLVYSGRESCTGDSCSCSSAEAEAEAEAETIAGAVAFAVDLLAGAVAELAEAQGELTRAAAEDVEAGRQYPVVT